LLLYASKDALLILNKLYQPSSRKASGISLSRKRRASPCENRRRRKGEPDNLHVREVGSRRLSALLFSSVSDTQRTTRGSLS
jgi:hypothetical protein